MTKHSDYSRKYLTFFACLIPLTIYLLLLPVQMLAQSGSTSFSQLLSKRVSRIQVYFTYGPTYPAAGQEVKFTDTSTGSPTSWQWNFGDGSTSTAQSPSHAFAAPGFHRVSLTAGNSAGSRSRSRTLTVMPSAGAASFTYSPGSPATGKAVQFTDTSTNSPTSWQWHFGDGTTSTTRNPSHTYGTPAAYTVTLDAINGTSSKTASRTVTVAPSATLSASFTYSPASPAAEQTVQFTDTSVGSPTSWQWNLGDGTTSTVQNPSHTYASATSYTVTLTATNSSGSQSASRTVTVVPALTASFTFTPSSPAVGQAVQFTDTSTGSPTSWQWNFGDGATSSSQNPSHAFTAAASYTVTLIATNASGSKTVNRTVTVVSALAASFAYSPASPVAGQAVQFTDTSTGSPTSWQWNFGDGATSTFQNPSHTFTTPASYTVTLTVSNTSGSKSINRTVTVVPALAASFTYTPASPVAGQGVQFTDTSTGSPTSWQWNFGDGSTSTAQNPSHTYTTAGSYSVTLTVTNASGSKNVSRTVTVVPALIASFTFTPSSPVTGQVVQFTDTSTGSPTSWQWNFGDGATSTVQNPSHTFTTPASYTVTLTVSNTSGSKNTNRTVTVALALAASFTYTPASPVAGQPVQFTDSSTGSPTSWQWNFGDGATSIVQNPSHTYATVSSFTVTLTVSNGTGSNSSSRTVNILPSSTLVASFIYSPAAPVMGQAVQFTDTSTGSPTSWQWDFGDSLASTVQSPRHTYTAIGSYLVTLTIRTGSNLNSTNQTVSVGRSNAIPAASPSLVDVSTAIAAANAGDTIVVPAGSATWSSSLNVTKGISIIGAGIGNTIITGTSSRLISFNPDATTRTNQLMFRISGFTFGGSSLSAVIALSESNSQVIPIRNIRIDNNRFENSTGYPIDVSGNFWGVIDSNQFAGNLAFSVMGNEDSSWKTFYPVVYGTADNLYFEDNTFSGSKEFYFNSGHGGRWAFRHNTSTATAMGNPLFDQHGCQDFLGGEAYNVYALMLCEIYDNTFTGMTSGVNRWNYQRGGKLLFYNNAGTSMSGTPEITENDQTRNGANVPPPIYTPYDCYFWNNIWNGKRVNAIEDVDTYGTIAENVTFWNQKDGFDGTVGIGVGPLSARPTTCTIGVAYWATDTNILYKATATNTWTAYYTPYIYPHPLRNVVSK